MGDQDDKQWLYDNGHMTMSGGKVSIKNLPFDILWSVWNSLLSEISGFQLIMHINTKPKGLQMICKDRIKWLIKLLASHSLPMCVKRCSTDHKRVKKIKR